MASYNEGDEMERRDRSRRPRVAGWWRDRMRRGERRRSRKLSNASSRSVESLQHTLRLERETAKGLLLVPLRDRHVHRLGNATSRSVDYLDALGSETESEILGSRSSLHSFASLEELDQGQVQPIEDGRQKNKEYPVTIESSAAVTFRDCEDDSPPSKSPYEDVATAEAVDVTGREQTTSTLTSTHTLETENTAVVVQPALSIEETPEQASGPFKMVLGITVCLGKSEEECPHSQHTSWEGVFTNEGEIRLYLRLGGGLGAYIKYPPNESSMCISEEVMNEKVSKMCCAVTTYNRST